jgi:hypothetical protein
MRTVESDLSPYIESAPRLADYFQLAEVILVREDRLPDGGGKKRRSLTTLVPMISPGKTVHLLSYAGSHTAYTLAQLLPNNSIRLYAYAYDGGAYRQLMENTLDTLPNVQVIKGSLIKLLVTFYWQHWRHRKDIFLKFGGALSQDLAYQKTASIVRDHVGKEHTHFVPVASGNLLKALQTVFPHVIGLLTQPSWLRLYSRLWYPATRGLWLPSISTREKLVQDVYQQTGYTFDPVFMGPVLYYLKNLRKHDKKVCLWVTCPSLCRRLFTWEQSD